MKKIYIIIALALLFASCGVHRRAKSYGGNFKEKKQTIAEKSVKSDSTDKAESTLDSEETGDGHGDSLKSHSLAFGKEKAGAVCVNGLEKLEVAGSTDKGLLFVNQLHFYAPWKLEGRLFMQAQQERTEKVPVHFFDATVDLTVKEFPLHIGYTMGLDQLGRKPNTTYSGPALTMYWSDIRRVHKLLHILRTGISYVTLSEHLQTSHFEDSTVVRGKQLEYSAFFQLQPFHLSPKLSIFSEGLFRMRGENNFAEIELGLRHESVLEGLVGFGVRIGFENMDFHNIAGVIRFNISNPNPKHEIGRKKP